MEGSIGSMPTDKLVTRSRRVRRLGFLVVPRIECKSEGGADKESSIPRWMSRIGSWGCQRHQRSVPSVAAVVVRQAARTAKASHCKGMARGSGRFGGHAGLERFPGCWWYESGDTFAAGAEPSRRCFLGAWWRDITIPARQSGSPCYSLASGGSRCSRCARRCVHGR